MWEFIKKMLGGGNEVSSKRFWGSITFLSALILSYLKVLDSCEDIAPNKLELINTMYITGAFLLGIALVELFKPKS